MLGWSFKSNTNDSRESPAIYVAEKLFTEGASLMIFDPQVPNTNNRRHRKILGYKLL